MDTKKNLKPELKEIYERVMNTKSSTRPSPPSETFSPPPTATQPPVTAENTQVLPLTPPPVTAPPQSSPSEPFLTSSAPRAINDSSGFVFSTHGKTMPQQEKKEGPPAHSGLSSGSKTAKQENEKAMKMEEQPAQSTPKEAPTKNPTATGMKNSNLIPILLVLMAVFLGVYTLFWAFYFGII